MGSSHKEHLLSCDLCVRTNVCVCVCMCQVNANLSVRPAKCRIVAALLINSIHYEALAFKSLINKLPATN